MQARIWTLALPLAVAAAAACATDYSVRPGTGDAGPPVDFVDASAADGTAVGATDGATQEDGGGACTGASDDPLNCGACGHDCQGGDCSGGACQPVVFVAGEPGVIGMAVVGAELAWTRESAGLVRVMPLAGGAPKSLITVAGGGPAGPRGVASDGTTLFVGDRNAGKLSRWALDGGAIWNIGSINAPTGIATDGIAVFFSLPLDDSIDSADLAGKTIIARASGLNYPTGVAVSDGRIYASTASGILAAPADGGLPVTVISPVTRFRDGGGDLIHSGLAVQGTTVWFTIDTLGIVAMVPTAGGTATLLASNQAMPEGIAVSPTTVYWANSGNGTIMKLAR